MTSDTQLQINMLIWVAKSQPSVAGGPKQQNWPWSLVRKNNILILLSITLATANHGHLSVQVWGSGWIVHSCAGVTLPCKKKIFKKPFSSAQSFTWQDSNFMGNTLYSPNTPGCGAYKFWTWTMSRSKWLRLYFTHSTTGQFGKQIKSNLHSGHFVIISLIILSH